MIAPFAMRRSVKVAAMRCHICGCTDDCACEAGCWWVVPNVCSACVHNAAETLHYLSVGIAQLQSNTQPSAHLRRVAKTLFGDSRLQLRRLLRRAA